ncbi:MAG: tetraacyldisaccharide 4'-kinase, partial [Nitrospirales bacterium]
MGPYVHPTGSWVWSQPWLRWPLLALAVPYGAVVRTRLHLYARGWLRRTTLPCRVISVGNLTVGGTGKTPLVIALASWMQARGERVGVLSRGYGRRSRSASVLVSDGRRVLAGPEEAGDEPQVIARRCPGVVVAVGADRARLGRWVLGQFPLSCLILDDGFQHLALQRDVDLLVIDASDPRGLADLLPAGRLREPLEGAARASAVILTRADDPVDVKSVLAALREAIGKEPAPITVSFFAENLVDPVTGAEEPAERLSGRHIVAFSGIGNPSGFRQTLVNSGARLLAERVFHDHHVY